MKLITLEKVVWSLEEMSPEVKVSEEIRLRAIAAVDKMLRVKSQIPSTKS
jgi:quinolinate synthase